jgi:hypothetical protein
MAARTKHVTMTVHPQGTATQSQSSTFVTVIPSLPLHGPGKDTTPFSHQVLVPIGYHQLLLLRRAHVYAGPSASHL